MEAFFFGLPLPVNLLFIFVALYVIIRASHYLIDGAVFIAHEFRVSPLIIGASVVAMGTTSAENTVNLVIVLGGGDNATVVGNILGSNLINIGIELGVSALIAGLIVVPRGTLEKDIPLYFAVTGLVTALAIDGQLARFEAIILLTIFLTVLGLIIQYARAQSQRRIVLVEVTEMEAISHPGALSMTRRRALLSLFGGLVVLVLSSRLLILNTAALAQALQIPEFIIGMVIIGPGTSLPEIASSVQAARRGHPELVIGTAFGSCLFNLSLGLGLPALIQPLPVGESAILSFIFMNVVNTSLLTLLLLDVGWLGTSKTINRVIGAYLVVTYLGFIAYQVVIASGGAVEDWLIISGGMVLVAGLLWAGRRWFRPFVVARLEGEAWGQSRGRILCATRGGRASQPTHEQAIKLAQEQNAELLFLYVFDKRVLQQIVTPIVFDVDAQTKHMLALLQTTAQEQARQAGVRARVIVRTGSLREQLQVVAKEEHVSMVVLGSPTGERSVFQREALQALADEIEEATGVPVLALDEQRIVPVHDTTD